MNFNKVFTVFKKELKDLLRDRKTVIVGLIVPMVMFPILFGFMGSRMDSQKSRVRNDIKIAISSHVDNNFTKGLKSNEKINIVKSDDINNDLLEGNIYCALVIEDDFEKDLSQNNQPKVQLLYDDTSSDSELAMSIVKSYIEEYSKQITKQKLIESGVDVSVLNPINVDNKVISKSSDEEDSKGKIVLVSILPMILILYALTGPITSAIDLGAGEKERGTLEPLLTTGISRMQLFGGKILAISTMGILGTISSIIGLVIAFKTSSNMFGGDVNISMTPSTMILIFVTLSILLVAAGTIELAISIYARSFKEAQTYLMPVTFIALFAAYGTISTDIKSVSTMSFNIPLFNSVMILKEAIYEIYNPIHILLTIGWGIIYVVLGLLFIRYMLSKEEVIFRS